MIKKYEQLVTHLTTLGLKGLIKRLDNALTEAEEAKESYISFIERLILSELNYRVDRRYQRNMAGAHFPVRKDTDTFEFDKVNGITKKELSTLLDFQWVDNRHNVLMFGPPGLGKTHLAVGIGIKAIEKGYIVCFERMSTLIKLLKTVDIQRSSVFRLNRIMKSNLIIIDEIGYTPIEKKEANLFFNLISEMYEKTSVLITSNKGFQDWAEMMGDPIMTTALLDRLLHHSNIFNLNGKSYRIQNLKQEVK
jgi:DNA replication protein DnaC